MKSAQREEWPSQLSNEEWRAVCESVREREFVVEREYVGGGEREYVGPWGCE